MTIDRQITNLLFEGQWTAARELAARLTSAVADTAILSPEVLLVIRGATGDAPVPVVQRSLDHYFRNPILSTAAGLAATADAFYVNRRFGSALSLSQVAFERGDETMKCLFVNRLIQICLQCNQLVAAEQYSSEALTFASGRIDPLRLVQVASDLEMQRGNPHRALRLLEEGEDWSDLSDSYAEKQYQTAFSAIDVSLGDIGAAAIATERAVDAIHADQQLPSDSSDAFLAINRACVQYLSGRREFARTLAQTSVDMARNCLDVAALLDGVLLDILLAENQFCAAQDALNGDLGQLERFRDPAFEAFLAPTKGLVTALFARALAGRGNLADALAHGKTATIRVALGNDASAIERASTFFRNIVALTPFPECAAGAHHLARLRHGLRPATFIRKDGPIWS